MTRTAAEMVAQAKAEVRAITPEEAMALEDVLFVDVRDPGEVTASGKVAGAINVPRGMLEFRADPASPYHDPALDPERTVVLYCASGGRAALAGKALQDLGYKDVRHMGGFKDWTAKGLPVEE